MTTIKWAIGESGIVFTVTVALAVVLAPLDPVAVSTYFVVAEGATVAEPLVGRFVVDMGGVIVTDVAFEVVQLNEAD